MKENPFIIHYKKIFKFIITHSYSVDYERVLLCGHLLLLLYRKKLTNKEYELTKLFSENQI